MEEAVKAPIAPGYHYVLSQVPTSLFMPFTCRGQRLPWSAIHLHFPVNDTLLLLSTPSNHIRLARHLVSGLVEVELHLTSMFDNLTTTLDCAS